MSPVGAGRGAGGTAPGWDIVGAANGGYLLAMAARAAALASGRPDPVTVTAHYLAPGAPGPVTVDTEVVKAGKRVTPPGGGADRHDRPPRSRGRLPPDHLLHRSPRGVGAHHGAHRPRASPSRRRMVAMRIHHALHHRGIPRGGRRGVGLGGAPRGSVAPTGAPAAGVGGGTRQ